jgi:hypothetical protein
MHERMSGKRGLKELVSQMNILEESESSMSMKEN